MALPADFNKIFGSTATGGLTPIGDVNYAKGWEFVGANPPTKNDFSYLQNLSDLKSQWLHSNKLQRTNPFGDIKADGAEAINTALSNLGLKTAAQRDVGTGANQIPDMSNFTSGSGANGWWRKGPDGVIEQYGLISNMSSKGITPAFPIAFPSEMRSFTIGVTGNAGADNYPIATVSLVPAFGSKLTHFTVTGYNTGIGGVTQLSNVIFYYHATGI